MIPVAVACFLQLPDDVQKYLYVSSLFSASISPASKRRKVDIKLPSFIFGRNCLRQLLIWSIAKMLTITWDTCLVLSIWYVINNSLFNSWWKTAILILLIRLRENCVCKVKQQVPTSDISIIIMINWRIIDTSLTQANLADLSTRLITAVPTCRCLKELNSREICWRAAGFMVEASATVA